MELLHMLTVVCACQHRKSLADAWLKYLTCYLCVCVCRLVDFTRLPSPTPENKDLFFVTKGSSLQPASGDLSPLFFIHFPISPPLCHP